LNPQVSPVPSEGQTATDIHLGREFETRFRTPAADLIANYDALLGRRGSGNVRSWHIA
jgi:hypothetical protein